MAFNVAELRRKVAGRAIPLAAVGLAIAISGTSLLLGRQASAKAAALDGDHRRLTNTVKLIGDWRSSFRAPTDSESRALLSEVPRAGDLGIPAGRRFVVLETMTQAAEDAGLRDIEVNVGDPDPDSAFVPPREKVGQTQLDLASYVVSIDFTGSFASLLKFVSNTPPSLVIRRLGVATGDDGVRYKVIFSVYEIANAGSD
jgi:hypothetical protein